MENFEPDYQANLKIFLQLKEFQAKQPFLVNKKKYRYLHFSVVFDKNQQYLS